MKKRTILKRLLVAFVSAAVTVGTLPASLESVSTVKAADSTELDDEQYTKIENISNDTIIGADLSYCQTQQDWGKTFADFDGNSQTTALPALKQAGVNTISVKVAVNPSDDHAYYRLENGIATLKAAESAGFSTNLVLMYSDELTWRNYQQVPAAWAEEEDLEAKALSYTGEVMDALEEAGLSPDIITIGHNIGWEFLGYSGDDSWKVWESVAKLAKAVRERSADAKIAVGITADNDSKSPTDIQWILEKLNQDWLENDYGFSYDYVDVTVASADMDAEYIASMREQFESSEEAAGKTAKLYISDVSYDRASEKVNKEDLIMEQADGIYHSLKATISAGNSGGIIYDSADIVGDNDWGLASLFDEYGTPVDSIRVLGLAQGMEVAAITRDPYQYGTENSLKDEEVTFTKIDGMTKDTVKGVDVSSYIALENAGVTFSDNDGNEKELMQILSENGVNSVRIRLWNDPYNSTTGNTYGGGVCDLETGLKIAEEATKYNMNITICLQYSDFWTDPAQQHLPKAWVEDEGDVEKMSENVYNYTKEVLDAFNEIEGINIQMVQVGNEITNGFMNILVNRAAGDDWQTIWEDKEKSTEINTYLKAGIKAVREETPDALVVLHLETPNVDKYATIMDTWERDGVDYDVLGSSYYPFYSPKVNTPENLTKVMQLASDYGKLFAVVETAWANTTQDADGTANTIGANRTFVYDVSPQGQVDAMTQMYQVLTSGDNALGAFYWEPAWVPVNAGWRYWQENKDASNEYGTGWAAEDSVEYLGEDKYYYKGEPVWGGSSWDNNTLFDMHGTALKSLAFFKEADSGEQVQKTILSCVDEEGNEIGRTFVDVPVGEQDVASLPTIFGYAPTKNVYSFLVQGSTAGMTTIRIKYHAVIDAKLYTTSYTYNGKVKKPAVKVVYGSTVLAKKTLKSTSDITVTYASGRKNVGKYKVTIKGKGEYAGTKTLTFTIKPPKTAVKKLTAGSGKMTVQVTQKKTQVTGYKIQYSTSSTFTSAKTVTVKGYKNTSKVIKSLKHKTVYYVRVATYKGSYTSAWSAVKKVKVK